MKIVKWLLKFAVAASFLVGLNAFAETATLETNYGPIVIELDSQHTPVTTQNFLTYAKNGFYNGTIFHRVINGFMIQGGGLDVQMHEKPTQLPIINEADKALPNKRGTVAMARTSNPNSATAQFFINVADNDFLNFSSKTQDGWGYAVFGKVTKGMDVVDKIKAVPTSIQNGQSDVPVKPVIIEKVTISG